MLLRSRAKKNDSPTSVSTAPPPPPPAPPPPPPAAAAAAASAAPALPSPPPLIPFHTQNNEWNSITAAKHLKDNWANPASPVTFLGIRRIYEFYNKKLKLSEIKNILQTIDSWSLMKMNRYKKKSLNKFTCYHLNDLWMVDTCDVSELKDTNLNVQHLFSAIDCFSRKAYVIPLFSHTADDGIHALKQIFHTSNELPQNIGSDKGSECGSEKVKTFLNSLGIHAVILSGPSKAANVEIFQKSLQQMIYKHITEYENLSYITVLPLLVNSYNERIHSATGYTPNEVESSKTIQAILQNKVINTKVNDISKKIRPSLKVGDWVRISLKRTQFSRSYNVQNTYERFKIYKIVTRFKNPRYFIQEEDKTKIHGSFSEAELTKINLDKFKASVIKSKTVKGKKWDLMDYKGYAQKYQNWQLADDS